ncbi:MAG: hypothetical protein NT049_08055 [Planctomycetota bacterium]|nr:hypothetical protein [Planctomycetota bacterium]
MIQTREDYEGVAPINLPYVRPPEHPPAVAWRWMLRLVGQLRRQYLSYLRPKYVAKARAASRGQCRCCGSCCDLTFHCPFLNDTSRCDRYEKRTLSCRDFPLDATDLRLTRVPCGHYYDSPPEDKARADSSG